MKMYQVDSFSTEPFAGNPAGVCLLVQPASDEWMQSIASELNLSETAFLLREGDCFRLRWFTPQTEVALCGHATLAAAHVLFTECLYNMEETIRFLTLSGELRASMRGDNIWLDFPTTDPKPLRIPENLLRMFRSTVVDAAKNDTDWLLELDDPRELRAFSGRFDSLETHPSGGIILTARSDVPKTDFIYRYFAPWLGIDEDPVTGSAQVLLVPYWMQKLHQDYFRSLQVSKRGGELVSIVKDDRVLIGGQAITIFSIDLKYRAQEDFVL